MSDPQKCPRKGQIPAHPIALNLNKETVDAECGLASIGELPGCAKPFTFQRPRQQPIAPGSRKNDHPLLAWLERTQRETRIEPLGAEMCLSQQTTDVGVPLWRFGKEDQLRAVTECDFRARDGLDAEGLGCLRERKRAVDAVAIGEGDGGIPQPVGFGKNLVGRGSTIEK